MKDRTGECWFRDSRYPYVAIVLSSSEVRGAVRGEDTVHEHVCLASTFDGRIVVAEFYERYPWESDQGMTRVQ